MEQAVSSLQYHFGSQGSITPAKFSVEGASLSSKLASLTARAPLPTAAPDLAKRLITTQVSQGLTCVGASFIVLGSGDAAASTESSSQIKTTTTGAVVSSTGGRAASTDSTDNGSQASSTPTNGAAVLVTHSPLLGIAVAAGALVYGAM